MTPRVRWVALWAVVVRDVTIVVRSRAVLVTVVLLPAAVVSVPSVLLGAVGDPAGVTDEVAVLLDRLPEHLLVALPAAPGPRLVVLVVVHLFTPLFLLVPALLGAVAAADTVVGERERGTIEGLLHTPTTDRELLLGKAAAPWGIAVVTAVAAAILYGVVANATLTAYGLPWSFPNLTWAVLVVWVTPAAAGLAVALILAVAVRLDTFSDAAQAGAVVAMPVVGLVVGQIAGVIVFDTRTLAALGGLLWLLTLLLLRVAGRSFSRDRLVSRG